MTPADLPPRIAGRVQVEPDACWRWLGTTTQGYGKVRWQGRHWRVHRLVYTLLVGPIPAGLTLDHLCHTLEASCRAGNDCLHRRCCNPAHVEPVTAQENTRRGRANNDASRIHWRSRTHCPYGHEYDGANTGITKRGARICRACARERKRARIAGFPIHSRDEMRAWLARYDAEQVAA